MNSDLIIVTSSAKVIVTQLLSLCESAAAKLEDIDPKLSAYHRDRDFLADAIRALSTGEKEEIETLWNRVQYLSRFFGGDYIWGSPSRDEFEKLCGELFDKILDTIRCLRSSS